MYTETDAVHPFELLLPVAPASPESWACVACDQFTSEPDYWAKVSGLVANRPSTLNLMLPECYLSESEKRIPQIHHAMQQALDQGILRPAVQNGYVLCERTTASGTRLGLVCTVDLEQYDFTPGTLSPIRPTEQTISSRLPARLAIRRGAPLELSHILILIDDPRHTVLEPLRERKASFRSLYDFDLMLDGGHLSGWAIDSEEDLSLISQSMHALRASLGENPLFLAVGDGNHSLATAKAYWNEIRETLSETERKSHPARFALCEIENIHDPALLFEPIHRLLSGVNKNDLLRAWHDYAASRGMLLSENGSGHAFTLISASDEQRLVVSQPEGAIPCETLQKFLDDFLNQHSEVSIDYIHGEQSLRSLASEPDHLGFLLPSIDKHSFFDDVKKLGVLPRKTFSMGEAREKRYYMECKRI